MPTTPSSSESSRLVASTSDLEALRREIANVQEERRLLFGRLDELRSAPEDARPSALVTHATYAFSFVAIVGFVVVVALNPPRVPPVKVLVPAPASAGAGPTSTEVRPVASAAVVATPSTSPSARPHVRRGNPDASRATSRDDHTHTDPTLLRGIEDGDDPLGDLAHPRR